MSKNVYMAFLGTNDYKICNYLHNNKSVKASVRFVQEATIEFVCREWGNNDRIFIFATKDAKTKNWSDNGHIDRDTNSPLERKGLETCLRDMALTVPYELVDIPEGHSEEEIWKIFEIIISKLNENDTVYFDITHAFRSIPMLAIVALNYGKTLKQVHLGGIFYGAFEVLGPISSVDDIPVQERNVPVLDLTAFDRMMDWVSAVDRFVESGNADLLSQLSNDDARSILSATRGEDRSQHSIRKLSKDLKKFTDCLNTCRGREITTIIQSLQKDIQACEQAAFSPPFTPVFDKLKTEISRFPGDDMRNGIQAARWCLEHNLVQQAYTILLEFLVSHFIRQMGKDPYNDRKLREITGQAIAIYCKNIPCEKWKEPAKSHKEKIDEIYRVCTQNKKLVHDFPDINDKRNDMNHAGIRDNPAKSKTLKTQLNNFIKTAETHFGLI